MDEETKEVIETDVLSELVEDNDSYVHLAIRKTIDRTLAAVLKLVDARIAETEKLRVCSWAEIVLRELRGQIEKV